MTVETKKRVFLGKDDLIERFENNLVTLKLKDGEEHSALEPRRLFPVSKIENFITLLNPDGKEIGVIKNLSDLNEESAQVIKESIDNYYLVPYINEILSVTEKSGTAVWKVRTNRGIKQFEISDRNHDIKAYRDNKIRIRDSADNRYVIDDYRNLNSKSRKFLIPYL